MTRRIGRLCRNVAVMVIAGVDRKRSFQEISQRITARPLTQQIMITASILALLFALSLLAAQFGWIGILIFWLAVIALIN